MHLSTDPVIKDTCATCTEFCSETEECGCPLNAHLDMYLEQYKYAKTAANSQACYFYSKITLLKSEPELSN